MQQPVVSPLSIVPVIYIPKPSQDHLNFIVDTLTQKKEETANPDTRSRVTCKCPPLIPQSVKRNPFHPRQGQSGDIPLSLFSYIIYAGGSSSGSLSPIGIRRRRRRRLSRRNAKSGATSKPRSSAWGQLPDTRAGKWRHPVNLMIERFGACHSFSSFFFDAVRSVTNLVQLTYECVCMGFS